MHRRLLAEPAGRRTRPPRRTTAPRRCPSRVAARRPTGLAQISVLVHRSRAERNGQSGGESRVALRGAGARTRGEARTGIDRLRSTPLATRGPRAPASLGAAPAGGTQGDSRFGADSEPGGG